jgi:hypothetical protein
VPAELGDETLANNAGGERAIDRPRTKPTAWHVQPLSHWIRRSHPPYPQWRHLTYSSPSISMEPKTAGMLRADMSSPTPPARGADSIVKRMASGGGAALQLSLLVSRKILFTGMAMWLGGEKDASPPYTCSYIVRSSTSRGGCFC